MNLEIIRPIFLLLIPVFVAIVIYTFKDLKTFRKRNTLAAISRIIIFTLLCLALSGITIKLNIKDTSTLFLFDVSESNKEFKEEGEKFIKESIESMPKKNKAAVMVFGDGTILEKFFSKGNAFNGISDIPLSTSTSTNIEDAITKALLTFPEESAKRLVIITDGEENKGSLLKTASSLETQNVEVKVYKVNKSEKPEVYVDKVSIPERINIGDEFSVVITIESNVKTSAKVSLYSDRTKKAEQSVDVEKGKNNFVFKDIQDSGGFKSYKVVIEPTLDSEVKNNEYLTFTNAEEKPKILLIESKDGEGKELENIFSTLSVNYSKINSKEAPRNLKEMLEFKSIITANVHIDDINKGFVDNLEDYVKEYAGSFIATGGEDSFALGGYLNTPFEKVLPVYMDMRGKKEIPKMALALVIDHSGSMGGGENITKLALAKEAAEKAVETLRPIDDIGVLAFDDSFNWVVPIKNSKDKEDIKSKIRGIDVNGGTSIYPALKEAYDGLKNNDAKIKHIILLTDGQDGFNQYEDVLSTGNDEKITLSTVSVGSDADKTLLQNLASLGGGRSYHTDIYTDIPRIFAKEIFLSSKSYLNNREFTPKLTSPHNILNGVAKDGFPTLLGYVGSSAKETSSIILSSDEDDPILTAWQYGLGRSVAWNSDMAGRWSKNLSSWNKTTKLWQNILNWSIESYGDGEGIISVNITGKQAFIEYETKNKGESQKVNALVTSEKGEKSDLYLEVTKPGKYSGVLDLKETGFYSLNIREIEDEKVINSQNTTIAMQYSPEYKFFKDKGALDKLVEETKGTFVKSSDEIFNSSLESVWSRIDLSNILLSMALVLFIIDIAYRRLNLNTKLFKVKGKTGKQYKKSKKSFKKNINNEDKDTIKGKLEKVSNKDFVKSNFNTLDETENNKKDIDTNKDNKKQNLSEKSKTLDTSSLLRKKEERNKY
ncbi:VWA domain-containing protein [Clostridium algidicarnis]|uniref:VWA domain-containing protein n=1 Tax=Clostridium algidicarnis TaxID=37659 RepID=UPI001C0B50FC|nr:VWA domain-containing protein [Clostridium algidicarnis]